MRAAPAGPFQAHSRNAPHDGHDLVHLPSDHRSSRTHAPAKRGSNMDVHAPCRRTLGILSEPPSPPRQCRAFIPTSAHAVHEQPSSPVQATPAPERLHRTIPPARGTERFLAPTESSAAKAAASPVGAAASHALHALGYMVHSIDRLLACLIWSFVIHKLHAQSFWASCLWCLNMPHAFLLLHERFAIQYFLRPQTSGAAELTLRFCGPPIVQWRPQPPLCMTPASIRQFRLPLSPASSAEGDQSCQCQLEPISAAATASRSCQGQQLWSSA
jgi:hypothetical protein